MARRAIRKVDSELDLSAHLVTFDELPRPWSTEALFGRQAPLEVEIGSGKGLFLLGAAAAEPAHDFLGIEVAGKYARYAAGRLARRGLNNARLLTGDAVRLFAEWLPDDCLAAVHVYFPDPWWKKRHHKRRVMRESLVRDVERTLQPGGALHFWTDVEEYFQLSLDLIASCTRLAGPFEEPVAPAAHDLDYRTNYERRTRLAGQRVFRARFEKP